MTSSEVLARKDLPPGAKLFYFVLLDRQLKSGNDYVDISLSTLQEIIGVSVPTILRYRQTLVADGLIEEISQKRHDGGDEATRFKVLVAIDREL